MNYFKSLLELLKIERAEDQRSYLELTQKLSVSERRSNGLSWYPVAIRDTELSRGDYLTVELERTTHHDIVHQFRFGASARLFSQHDAGTDYVDGIISHQSGNKMKITLRTDELPEWSRNGKLGVDLLFDDNSYDEMQQALRLADSMVEKKEEGRLARILVGEENPTFNENEPGFKHPSLNDSQKEAVSKILLANELAIVHGPPGTGKTTTLVQAIKAVWERDRKQILVVASSNTAVDLLSERLSMQGMNVLRVGNPARVSDNLLSLTLDSKMLAHPRMKEIKKMKKQAAEFRDLAHKYKRHFGKAEREQRKALFDEAHKIMKEVVSSEQYIIDDLISKAQVITATLVGANHFTVKHLRYDTVFIDEAGQALEPACWIPILKAKKLVLAGDHCQLSPTIKSTEAARGGLSNTLLEKMVARHPEAVSLLDEQYRMHEKIMGYSSSVFYENKLRANDSVAGHLLFHNDEPLHFVDTAGCGFEEKSEGSSTSNPEEAAFVFKHLSQLLETLKDHYHKNDFPSIAVISPYRRQVELLKELLEQDSSCGEYRDFISVNTIDSFQGQERDVVYISMTRSNADNRIGFLSEIRRMNVAMTRARKKLVVVGDSATLSQLDFYANLIGYAEKNNYYKSAWEYMS